MFLFGVFGDMRREFMQRLHDKMGSYLRDALHEGNVDPVGFLFLRPRVFPLFFFLLGGLHCFILQVISLLVLLCDVLLAEAFLSFL
jgi:hypothetical protein